MTHQTPAGRVLTPVACPAGHIMPTGPLRTVDVRDRGRGGEATRSPMLRVGRGLGTPHADRGQRAATHTLSVGVPLIEPSHGSPARACFPRARSAAHRQVAGPAPVHAAIAGRSSTTREPNISRSRPRRDNSRRAHPCSAGRSYLRDRPAEQHPHA